MMAEMIAALVIGFLLMLVAYGVGYTVALFR